MISHYKDKSILEILNRPVKSPSQLHPMEGRSPDPSLPLETELQLDGYLFWYNLNPLPT